MDRPLAIGGVSGVATSLLYSFLLGIYQDLESHSVPITLPSLSCPVDCRGFQIEDANFWVFAAGILVGLTAGPCVDLLYLLRQRWRRWVWRVLAAEEQSSRALHKVLA